MTMTPLPDPPSILDPENFSAKADAFVAALVTFQAELNAIIGATIPAGSAAAGTLTGDTLANNVVNSSLTSLGTIANLLATLLAVSGQFTANGNVTLGNNGADVLLMTTNAMKVTAAGEITLPLQPAFLAFLNATQNNVTGNGEVRTVLYNEVVYDRNADFDYVNHWFVAPVAARYVFHASVGFSGAAGALTRTMIFVSSNRNYVVAENQEAACGAQIVLSGTCFADMDAGDTMYVSISLAGIGSPTADTLGLATYTYFSGALIC